MARIPLALLPGTLCTARLWEHQVAALSDIAAIRIIDTSRYDALDSLAKHVHYVMPTPFAVAGLSYGGIAAFAVWRQQPEAISHLGLLSTTPLPITPEKRLAQEGSVEMAESGEFGKVIAEHAQNILLHSGCQQNHTYRSQILDMAVGIGVKGFANQIKAQIERPDSRSILGKIQCSTLVLCGDQDRFCPPDIHREMAEQIPQATLHVISACGHLSTMEQPECVSQAMRNWLLF